MGAEVRGEAVLLDAMGTLVRLDDPVGRLRTALASHTGADVGSDGAARALRAEIAYYRAHLHTAVDPPSLALLRAACAEAMRPALPEPVASAEPERLLAALMEGIAFAAYADAARALRELRALGLRLVVVSNWDVSLHERLAETGLTPLLDGAVASVEVGAAKPDGAPFARGLELAGGIAPEAAWHVGDDLEADIAGARAAGLRPVLLDRDGDHRGPPDVPVLRGLDALPALIRTESAYA
jgi:putative hydrolase of the HAD superfamily